MKKRLFVLAALSLVLFSVFPRPSQARDAGDPYVILVEFLLNEATLDEAIDLLLEIQTQTLENEDGCLVYDVLLSEENPAQVFLYESYESGDAYKVHTNAPYYKEIVLKKLKPLIKSQKIIKVYPLNFEGENAP